MAALAIFLHTEFSNAVLSGFKRGKQLNDLVLLLSFRTLKDHLSLLYSALSQKEEFCVSTGLIGSLLKFLIPNI